MLFELLKSSNLADVQNTAKIEAKKIGLEWSLPLKQLVECIWNNPEFIPGKILGVDLSSSLSIWLKKYSNGLNSRFKTRVAKPSNVKRDPILTHVLQISNSNLSVANIEEIFDNHTLAMAIENNIGSLLEDYIASVLEPKGWVSAWGSTLHAVDFYKPKANIFLQVKNRSNSENSSSMSVRIGTDIKKWYRINAQSGKTYWTELEKITGVKGFSEQGFFDFIKSAIAENPKLFYFGAMDNT